MDFSTLEFMKEFDETYITKDDLLKLYKFLSLDGKIPLKNFENLKNSLYVTSYRFKHNQLDRLATKKEVDKAIFGVYYVRDSILDYYKTRYIEVILDFILYGETYISDINKEKLIKTYEYMFTDDFKKDLVKIKSKTMQGYSLSYSHDGELTKDVLKIIKRELDPDYGTKYSIMAFNIAKKALRDKKYILSKSQFECINIEYSKILKSNSGKSDKMILDSEILSLAKELKAKIKGSSSYDSLILDICNQAITKNYLSEKQKEMLLKYRISDSKEESTEIEDYLPDFNNIQWG